ncbi:MAG: hypothetical protein IJY44_00110, partial [Bacteroidaceae bacterium]|nr:hypothetical protein [Bacteroidaceae bacterium]
KSNERKTCCIVTTGSLRLRTAVEYKTSDSEVFVLTKKLLGPPTFAGEPLLRGLRIEQTSESDCSPRSVFYRVDVKL